MRVPCLQARHVSQLAAVLAALQAVCAEGQVIVDLLLNHAHKMYVMFAGQTCPS